MREAPVLFNQAMTPRVLDGSKTQTRRPIKVPEGGSARAIFGECNELLGARTYDANGKEYGWQKPIANVGDVLWVRETFYCDDAFAERADTSNAEWRERFLYFRADVPSGRFEDAGYWGEPGSHWKPSIHMPRWASRVTLPLVSVRVERVSAIRHEDAVAEGFADRKSFLDAWRQIYGAAEWCFVYEWSKAVIAGGSRE